MGYSIEFSKFQFLMVRLEVVCFFCIFVAHFQCFNSLWFDQKGRGLGHGGVPRPRFNSLWFDQKPRLHEVSVELPPFQFLMVRLEDVLPLNTQSINIRFNSLWFDQKLSVVPSHHVSAAAVSIPYGSIRRGTVADFSVMAESVSIPYGSIRSQVCRV